MKPLGLAVPGALRAAVLTAAVAVLGSCGGGGGSGAGNPAPQPVINQSEFLSASDVETVIAQAVGEAQAHGVEATIAVSDRVGNVLAVYRMTGASTSFTITDGRAVLGGLEGVNLPFDSYAAISEAVTAAYLSSNGNAFSTRTASQIIQENFNPGELMQPSGPLFGVQFSSLPCSDVVQSAGTTGPHNSPLGLSGSPGGLPLYKNGTLVGGVGAISNATYTIDTHFSTLSPDVNELIAVAASSGYAAPSAIRANMITANGRALRYDDSESILSNPSAHAAFASLPGALVTVPPYNPGVVQAGVAYGTAASGMRADTGTFADLGTYILVDGTNTPRYPPRAGTDGLMTAAEVTQILRQAVMVANHTRAQIRQPLNSPAQVSMVVVDTNGVILGATRDPDAPIFGIDVAVQKARTAAFFSSTSAAAQLAAQAPAHYLAPASTDSSIAGYVTAMQTFLQNPNAFADGTAYSAHAIGLLARPFYPDGINGNPNGPLSKPYAQWSVFSDGLQLDLVYNQLALALTTPQTSCTAIPGLANGIQIFPGAVPIYRAGQLVGAIGVSGDGVNQDDLVSFLGLANAATALGDGIGNAPAAIRADRITPPNTGVALEYVQCPQSPFLDTDAQGVCNGL